MFTKDELLKLEELARTNPLIAKMIDSYQIMEKDLKEADDKINDLEDEIDLLDNERN